MLNIMLEKNNDFIIDIEKFKGPLDVLVELVKENKLDIMNLNLSSLTKKYLAYINENLKKINIEESSAFLLMATYLIKLKSKKLLSEQGNEDEKINYEYERDKLVARLLEHKKYKDASEYFDKKKQKRSKMWQKVASELENYLTKEKYVEQLPKSIDIQKLLEAVKSSYDRYKIFNSTKFIVQELSVDQLEKEIIEYIQTKKKNHFTFEEFLLSVDELKISNQYIVTAFLGLLEMVKYGIILLEETSEQELIVTVQNLNNINVLFNTQK